MFYREAGDFKTSYEADSQTFPIKFDRYRFWAMLAVAYLVIPFIINDYWIKCVVINWIDISDFKSSLLYLVQKVTWSKLKTRLNIYSSYGMRFVLHKTGRAYIRP
jgi:hypothetical protein